MEGKLCLQKMENIRFSRFGEISQDTVEFSRLGKHLGHRLLVLPRGFRRPFRLSCLGSLCLFVFYVLIFLFFYASSLLPYIIVFQNFRSYAASRADSRVPFLMISKNCEVQKGKICDFFHFSFKH